MVLNLDGAADEVLVGEEVDDVENVQLVADRHRVEELRRAADGRLADLEARLVVFDEVDFEVLVGLLHVRLRHVGDLRRPLNLRDEEGQEEVDVLRGDGDGGRLDVLDEQRLDALGGLPDVGALD